VSSEVEELGAYVLRILDKMKKIETRIQKLEESVNDINNLIAEATEETEATGEIAPQRTQLTPLRLWAPLNIAKWIAVCSAVFWIANLRARMSLVAWNQLPVGTFSFWNTLDMVYAGVSLATAVGIEFFLYWRRRRTPRPSHEFELEETEAIEVTEEVRPETQEKEAEAKAITEESQESAIEPVQTPENPKTKKRARKRRK